MARSTTERRHARRVQDLRSLREQQPQQFLRVWQLFFQGWAQEVQHRARAQMRDASAEPIPAIFGVLRGARRLTQDVGVQRDPQVALSLLHLQHLQHLQHLYAKAVAGLMDGRLYAFGTETVQLRRGKGRRARTPSQGSQGATPTASPEGGKAGRTKHALPTPGSRLITG